MDDARTAPPHVQEHRPVPVDLLALTTLSSPDDADAFTLTGARPDRTAEQWARVVFEDLAGIGLLWRLFLGLHLRTRPDRVSGWDVGERAEHWVRLEITSWVWTNHLVVRVDGDRVTLATFVRYDRAPAASLWPSLAARHRAEAVRLLTEAAAV